MNLKTSLKRGPFSERQASQLNEVIPGLDPGQVQWLNGYLTGIEAVQAQTAPQTQIEPVQAPKAQSDPVWILYGTHTGNSEDLAQESGKRLEAQGRDTKIMDMEVFKTKKLKKIKELLIIVSTDGEGDPPMQAEEFLEYLQGKRAPQLDHMNYSVLALGDSTYAEFCQTGKDFDTALAEKGAQRLKERVDCDVDFEDDYEAWIEDVIAKTDDPSDATEDASTDASQVIDFKPETVYDRKNPFPATILKKVNLNGRGSSKETIHLELDLEDSQLHYEPGDALGIYGLNHTTLVDAVLEHLQFTGEEEIESHQGAKSLREALIGDYELTVVTNLSLKRYVELTDSAKLKEVMADKAALADYLYGRDILDLIREEDYDFTPQDFIAILRKNMPRMYSIASSQEEVEDEVHILVSTVRYEAQEREKEGVCSTYLADQLQTDDEVKVFVDTNSRFKLPEDPQKPIIMVGPGTGVAPFRSFMQQRDTQDDTGKSWLFFGARNFTTDFLYQSEWLQYRDEGLLTRADVAFSRDQQDKVYVQDRMLEQGDALYEWLEEGAHFYVCGDKDYMAKDVDQALTKIVQTHGGLDEEQAKGYIKALRKDRRYQTDIY